MSDTLLDQSETPLQFDCKDTKLLADRLKALAHPARLQILQSLACKDDCCCGELCSCIPLAQSTISQHLKILKNAGLVDCENVGNCSNYSLNKENLQSIMGQFSQLNSLITDPRHKPLKNGCK